MSFRRLRKVVARALLLGAGLGLAWGGPVARAIDPGNALTFDGSGDYVSLGNDSRLKPTGAFTLELWACPTAAWASSTGRLISCREGAGYGLSVGSSKVGGVVRLGADYRYAEIAVPTGMAGWHHLAMTWDGRYLTFYLDGVSKSQLNLGTGLTPVYDSDNHVMLGADAGPAADPAGEWFAGRLDEVRVWNVARSAGPIRTGMVTQLIGTETGLVAYYSCNPSSGTALPNLVSAGPAVGTLYGNTAWVPSGVPHETLWVDDDYAEGAGNDGHTWGIDAFSMVGSAVGAAFAFPYARAYHTIIVKDGIYRGAGNRDIDFGGKLLTVRSANGAEHTTIDCQGTAAAPHRAFYFGTAETWSARVEGFTITNGCMLRGGAIYCASGTSPTIANCLFTGNHAAGTGGQGGAIYSASRDGPFVQDCTFERNRSDTYAGAVWYSGTTGSFERCVFVQNWAEYDGGAICGNATSATFLDCVFAANQCNLADGGALRCAGDSSPQLSGCTFSGNRAGARGGAAFCDGGAAAWFSNCVFTANQATSTGGAVDCRAECGFMYCTMVGNTAAAGGGIHFLGSGAPILTNVAVSGNTGVALFEGDTLSDPVVTNCLLWANPNGDYRNENATVLTGAAAVNALAGNSGSVDGDPRFAPGEAGTWTTAPVYDAATDRTALTDTNASFTPGALVGRVIHPDLCVVANRATAVEVAGDHTADTALGGIYQFVDPHLTAGSAAIDVGVSTDVPAMDMDGERRTWNGTVDIGADEFVDTDGDGLADTREPDLGTDPLLFDTDGDADGDGDEVAGGTDPLDPGSSLPSPPPWYVDIGNTSGTADGLSWATAFTSVQAGIDAAFAAGGGRVWVAAGTYKPASQAASVVLASGVAVYGGFAGGETALPQRDIAAHPTVLSADLGVAGNAGDNGYHVVVLGNVTGARLDGFTISGGNASSAGGDYGGGVHCSGPGAGNALVNCTIQGNAASSGGGGVYCTGSAPVFARCTITGNTAGYYGGGVFCEGNSAPSFGDCSIRENSSNSRGGGVYCYGSYPYLDACTIAGNTAKWFGVGFYCEESSSVALVNCAVTDNHATDIYESEAGALEIRSWSAATLTHCTVSGNSACSTGGIVVSEASLALTNCILWGNSGQQVSVSAEQSGYSVARSIIQGSGGDLDVDPRFVDAAAGDYRLRDDSPAIDAGAVGAGIPADDIVGCPRDARPDLGAYEYPNTPPTAGPDLAPAIANDADVVLTLDGQDPDGDALIAVVTQVPGTGGLYQYAEGERGRGPAIASAPTAVTDPQRRVVYAPGNPGGDYSTSLAWRVTDGGATSANCATCSLQVRDVVPPAVAFRAPATAYLSPIVVTVTLTEPSEDFAVGDLALTNATVADFSGAGVSYQVELVPTTLGTVQVQVGIGVFHDLAGNANAALAATEVQYEGWVPPLPVGDLAVDVMWEGCPSSGSYQDLGGGNYDVQPPYRIGGLVVCPAAGEPVLQVRGTVATGSGPLALANGLPLLDSGQGFTLDAETGLLVPDGNSAADFRLNGRALHLFSLTLPASGALSDLRLGFQYPELPSQLVFTNVRVTGDATSPDAAEFTPDTRVLLLREGSPDPSLALAFAITGVHGFASGALRYDGIELPAGALAGVSSYGWVIHGEAPRGEVGFDTSIRVGSYGLHTGEPGTWTGTALRFGYASLGPLANTAAADGAMIQPGLANLEITPGTPAALDADPVSFLVDGMTVETGDPPLGADTIRLGNVLLPTANCDVDIGNVIISLAGQDITTRDSVMSVNGVMFQVPEGEFLADGFHAANLTVGAPPLKLDIASVDVDRAGFSVGGGGFSLAGLELRLAGGTPAGSEGLELEASLKFPPFFGAGMSGGTALFVDGDGKAHVSGLEFRSPFFQEWTIPKTKLTLPQVSFRYDDGPPEMFGGSLTIGIPTVVTLQGELAFADGRLERIRIEGSDLNKPIGTTGAFLDSVGAGVRNLARIPVCVTVDGVERYTTPPVEFVGSVGVTAGPKILGLSLVRGKLEGVVSEQGFQLSGSVYVFILKAGGGDLAVMWSGPQAGVSGGAWVYWMLIIRGEASFAISKQSQSVGVRAALVIPREFPFIGGKEFGNARLGYVSSPRSRMVGSVKWSFKVLMWRCRVQVAFHLDSDGFGLGERASGGIVCREWETPFLYQWTPPVPAGSGRSGEPLGVMTFGTNFEQQQRVYSDSDLLQAPAGRDEAVDLALTLTSRQPTFIRLTYEAPGGDPAFELRLPDGTVYSPDTAPFDADQERGAHYLANPEVREAQYLVFPDQDFPPDRAGTEFPYTVRILHPATLGEYGVEVLVQNATPSMAFENVSTDGEYLYATWTDDDPEDNAEIRFFLDTDRAGGDGVQIGEPAWEDDPANSLAFPFSSATLGAGVYWLYAQLYDGHSLSDPIYAAVPVMVGDVEAPPAPRNLRVAVSSDSALVTWDPPQDLGDRVLFNYKVLWTEDPSRPTYEHAMTALAETDAPSACVTGLEPNRRYRFTVKSVEKVIHSPAGRAAGFALLREAQEQLRGQRATGCGLDQARQALRACAATRGELDAAALEALAEQLLVSDRIAGLQERYLADPAKLNAMRQATRGPATAATREDEETAYYTESIQTQTVIVYTGALPGANNVPVIHSQPLDTATVGGAYSYQVTATDDDSQALNYALPTAPAGMAVSPEGLVTWVPGADQGGMHDALLAVSDGHGGTVEQRWQVTAASMPSLQPLAFLNAPECDWQPGTTFTFTPSLNRDDLSEVTWELVTAPTGMTVDAGPRGNTGTLTWPISAGTQLGSEYPVILIGRHGDAEATCDFTITIQAATAPVALDVAWSEAPVSIAASETDGGTAVTETGAADNYVIRITDTPERPVTVTLTPDFPLDLGSGPGEETQLTFAAGAGVANRQTVVVQAGVDAAEAGAYARTIAHTVVSDDARYHGLTLGRVTVQITKAGVGIPAGTIVVNNGAEWTLTPNANLALSVVDDGGAGQVEMRLSNDGLDWSAWGPFAAARQWTLPTGDGEKTVYAQFRDAQANLSGVGFDRVFLDATAPEAPLVGSPARITADSSPTWTWSGQGGGNGTFRYQLDGEGDGAWTETTGGTFTPEAALPDGDHTLYAQERDEAGNWSLSGACSVTVATTPPDPPVVQGRRRANHVTAVWTWPATRLASTYRYRFGATDGPWTVTSARSFRPAAALPEGQYTLYVQAGDAVGNWSATTVFTFAIDTTPPTALLTELAPFTRIPEVQVELAGTDAAGGAVAAWLLTGTRNPPAYDSPAWLAAQPATYTLTGAPGSITVYGWGQDDAGNVSPLTDASCRSIVYDPALCLMRLLVADGQLPELRFGSFGAGTGDFDDGVDEVAPDPEVPGGPYVVLVNPSVADPGKRRLRTDLRGSEELARWRVVVQTDAGRDAVALSWETADAAPDRLLYLQRLADEEPVGSPVDMKLPGSVAAADGSTFEIAYAAPATVSLAVEPGWNLAGIPVMTTVPARDLTITRDTPAAVPEAVWAWDGAGYRLLADDQPLNPERGYWLRCPSAGLLAGLPGILADGVIVLAPGWNLISPVASCPTPSAPQIIGSIWRWDADLQRYGCAGGTLEPGLAYWLYVAAPGYTLRTGR